MTEHIPIPQFRAFEAASRHLSFTRAAEELNVTPAAVSQQIRGLEEHYGVTLFERTTRSLALTALAKAVLPSVREGFASFRDVHNQLTAVTASDVLTVSIYLTLAEKWLIPRLERFRSDYPQIDIRIHATDELVDFTRDSIDVAVRYGTGNYPGLTVLPLITELAFPVCSPRVADAIRTPEDLRNQTLLHGEWRMERDVGANWRLWLRAAGLGDIDAGRGMRFNMESLLVQAAIDGLGVALMPESLVAGDISAGRLVRPFGDRHEIAPEFSAFIVYPPSAENNPNVVAFRDWALGEVRP
ncbi:MAG: transcriptional regulator GcvA [Alphaproteobacteria bacterium]